MAWRRLALFALLDTSTFGIVTTTTTHQPLSDQRREGDIMAVVKLPLSVKFKRWSLSLTKPLASHGSECFVRQTHKCKDSLQVVVDSNGGSVGAHRRDQSFSEHQASSSSNFVFFCFPAKKWSLPPPSANSAILPSPPAIQTHHLFLSSMLLLVFVSSPLPPLVAPVVFISAFGFALTRHSYLFSMLAV